MQDGKSEIRGEVKGITFDSNCMGKKVEVYAKIIDKNTLSIFGNKEYYVRVIEEKNIDSQSTECDFECSDNKKITCENNNDCNSESCINRGGLASSEFGFSGYCKNGICQKYGCGGVEPID
jgi:hypothetical protein